MELNLRIPSDLDLSKVLGPDGAMELQAEAANAGGICVIT
jgi:hypothetical protein